MNKKYLIPVVISFLVGSMSVAANEKTISPLNKLSGGISTLNVDSDSLINKSNSNVEYINSLINEFSDMQNEIYSLETKIQKLENQLDSVDKLVSGSSGTNAITGTWTTYSEQTTNCSNNESSVNTKISGTCLKGQYYRQCLTQNTHSGQIYYWIVSYCQ